VPTHTLWIRRTRLVDLSSADAQPRRYSRILRQAAFIVIRVIPVIHVIRAQDQLRPTQGGDVALSGQGP
jgi:hypothetical protein